MRGRNGKGRFFVIPVFPTPQHRSRSKRKRDISRREGNCVMIDGRIGVLCWFIYTPVLPLISRLT